MRPFKFKTFPCLEKMEMNLNKAIKDLAGIASVAVYIEPMQQIFHAKSPIHITGGRVQGSKMSAVHHTVTFIRYEHLQPRD